MFDGGGAGGFDMSNLLAQAQAMQNQLMEAQADLEGQEIEGSAGGGLVTALVSGTGELLSLDIKKEAVDPDDIETLADLIVAAVRDASENAKQAAAAAMGPLAGGLGGAFGGDAGGFPGFGDGTPSAPAGFGLPSATPPAVGAGDDEPGDAAHGSRTGADNLGQTGADNLGQAGADEPGQVGSDGHGVGFVNPGSAAGESGQNPG
ncbi:DNA-binding YbaB/EbfC family protein [Kribbella aluminosa]|uniref:Nucleoid-associated protein JOF29_005382 n=1 Tax=Kribbella aluminosa TaxID=416017 RepID=A0ABS4URK6_9ACTN|nr:YbaB/EbfC family nucleoid-associated protein [Kribbella aluminosa]MBP2354272.1 DNA-binding YbaB/EbfC family protein [Kribbella aluminosa]